MGASVVRLKAARRRYDGTAEDAFSGVDLSLARGETFALVGPSGCGKSTLMRVLAGLDALDGGTLERSAGRGHPVLVTQRPALLPWLDVRENVRYGGRLRANRGSAGRVDLDALLTDFGIAQLADRYPDELSGGQQQLVAIARAVAIEPDVLLLDEPFAALDPAARATLQDWLRRLADERGLTIAIVTHDPDEALYLGHRVGLLRRGVPGIGPVWETGRPQRRDLPLLPARAELLSRYETRIRLGRELAFSL